MKHLPWYQDKNICFCEMSVMDKDMCPICLAEHRGETLRRLNSLAVPLSAYCSPLAESMPDGARLTEIIRICHNMIEILEKA